MDRAVVDSIEFAMTDLDAWGMREVHGLAHLEPDALVLEFRTSLMGLVRTGLKEVRIPLLELVDVEFDYRIFYTLIRLRTRTLKTLEGIPGVTGASVKLQLKGWQSRKVARAFVAEINYQRAVMPDPSFPRSPEPPIRLP